MKNSNQRVFYISDSHDKVKPPKVETVKNNDLIADGQKFIDFQEPNDVPVNHLNNFASSNFFKQFENRDLIEYPDEPNNNTNQNNPHNNQGNISRQPNLFYDNVKSKYFNNLNFPLQQRNDTLLTQTNKPNYLINPTDVRIHQNNKIEEELVTKKLSSQNSRDSFLQTKTKTSQQSQLLSTDKNTYGIKSMIPNVFSGINNSESINFNNFEDIQSKQNTHSKENNKKITKNVQTNKSEGLPLNTNNPLKRDDSPLNINDNNINNTNYDLEFLNTLLKLKSNRDDNLNCIKIDESRSYTREIIGSDNREPTPGREYGDLFFNENISQISHNKSNSYLLNNISNNIVDNSINQKNLIQQGNTPSLKINSVRSNNQIENYANIHQNNQTKLNKNDLIEITNKRRNLINNSEISSVEGHFRRRHNEALVRIEKLRKEKLEKENSEIKAHPQINKKSKEIAEKLKNRSRPKQNNGGRSKEKINNYHNNSGNNISNNVKIFNYQHESLEFSHMKNQPNEIEGYDRNNLYNNKYEYDAERGRHVNNINLYIGKSLIPNMINNMKLNVTDDDPRKRNHSTENLKKSNTNSSNNLCKREEFVIETNRIQIINEEKNNKPKIEDYDKLVMLSELVNLGTKSKKNTEKLISGNKKEYANVTDHENKFTLANNYGTLDKEFIFSYDSNKIHNNLQNINQIDVNNQKVIDHCELDLFDNEQYNQDQNNNIYQNKGITNSYNLKESACSKLRVSEQLYPVIDRNLDFEIENPNLKDPLSTKNLYDPNETHDNNNTNYLDKNKTITNNSNFNQIKYIEPITSNFSMNFSKYSHMPNQNNLAVPCNNDALNKNFKPKLSNRNISDMTNKNMVNSYISNYNNIDSNTKNFEISNIKNRKEDFLKLENNKINLSYNKEDNNKNEFFKEGNVLNENKEKNIYAAEIDLFDDNEDNNIAENENLKENEKRHINNNSNFILIKEVKEKMNYFESENDINQSSREEKTNKNYSNMQDNIMTNTNLEEKDLLIKSQQHIIQENKIQKDTVNSRKNNDLIIPNYLNKIVAEKLKKSVNNNTDINASSLMKSTSTLKISGIKSNIDEKKLLSKSVNKMMKRTNSVDQLSKQKRSDSVPEDNNTKTRNADKNTSIVGEKSSDSNYIYKSTINMIKKTGNNISKGMKHINIKKVTNNIDNKKNKNVKSNQLSKDNKTGSNNQVKTSKTTNITNSIKTNNKDLKLKKANIKTKTNNNTVLSNNENDNIILEEENGDEEENFNKNDLLINKVILEKPVEKENEKSASKPSSRYNFTNLNNETKTNSLGNKITSIKYDYNEIIKLHRQKQKQCVEQIQSKLDGIIKSQEHVEISLKQDYRNMNIDESSIMRDSTAFKKDGEENRLN